MQKKKMKKNNSSGKQHEISQVTPEEKKLLEDAANIEFPEEDEELKKSIPDNVDEDGDPLNENISYKDLSASDLDIPDDYEDDEDEELGKLPKDDY